MKHRDEIADAGMLAVARGVLERVHAHVFGVLSETPTGFATPPGTPDRGLAAWDVRSVLRALRVQVLRAVVLCVPHRSWLHQLSGLLLHCLTGMMCELQHCTLHIACEPSLHKACPVNLHCHDSTNAGCAICCLTFSCVQR